MSESGESRGPQISLKGLLIGVPLAGATLGLLGRTFYRDPDKFRLALLLVTVVAPFILAVGTIIRLGWRGHRRALMIWGVILAMMPFIGYGVMRFADFLYGTHGYGIVDNATLIKQRLPNELSTPWVWQELERRVQHGYLSHTEVDEAVQTLTRHMQKNRPQGWDRPLHFEGKFVRLAAQSQLISEQTLFDLCDAFYGRQPKFDPFPFPAFDGRHRIEVEFGSPWDFHSRLPMRLIWFPKRILVDGKTVQFQTLMAHGTDWDGEFTGNVEDGDHAVTVEVECAYVDNSQFDPFNSGCVERNNWPQKQFKTWTTSITDQVTLKGGNRSGTTLLERMSMDPRPWNGAAEIVPTTRSTSDPTAINAVNVERVVVKPGADEVLRASLELVVGDNLRIPLSCDVTLNLGEATYQLGSYYCAKWPSRDVSSGGEFQVNIEKLASDVKRANIALTPNSSHIEQIPGVSEIWGKPIVFPNVPVERIDLQAKEP